jgi:hypothetical protein
VQKCLERRSTLFIVDAIIGTYEKEGFWSRFGKSVKKKGAFLLKTRLFPHHLV